MLLRKGIPWTYLILNIKGEIAGVVIYSVLIGVWHQELEFNHISIQLAVPGILGTIISFLLAFRSNQAYDRWWEARVIWGAIVNDSRSLIRQLQCYLPTSEEGEELRFLERFAKRQISWTYCLGRCLRGITPFEKEQSLLDDNDLTFALKSTNVPNALLSLHNHDLKIALQKKWINEFQQVHLSQTLANLNDSMGKCERIKNTVFPTTYSSYIRFTLYLFILILPFGLTQSLGYVQVPVVVGIACSFILIEKTAIYLQDPFENRPTDTPMTALAWVVERDIRQMVNSAATEGNSMAEGAGKLAESYFVL